MSDLEGELADQPPNKKPRTEDILEQMEESKKWKSLVQQMDTYIANNLSTTSSKSQDKANTQATVFGMKIENMFRKRNIAEVNPLTDAEWEIFANKITEQVNPSAKNERLEVHPTLQKILQACLDSVATNLRCQFEKSLDEDTIIKIPDATLFAKLETSESITAAVIPHEFKLPNNLVVAAYQGAGYCVSRLRGQLETVDPKVEHLCGFSVGCDGENIMIGFAEVKKMELLISFTAGAGILLWPTSDKPRPTSETEGIHILRRLYATSLKKLGHELNTLEVDDRYKFIDLVGKGSFCSVITVHDRHAIGTDTGPHCVLKRPIATPGGRHTRPEPDQLTHMAREVEVLRVFTQANKESLPKLYDIDHTPTMAAPYLTILPIGTPLANATHGLRKDRRKLFAENMFTQCCSALRAASELGYCHSDIGPDNIVVANNTFYLVDWGLARRDGDPMHEYQGRLRFMHDDLILYFDRKEDEVSEDDSVASGSPVQRESIAPVPFLSDYDFQSLRYVHYSVVRGKPGLAVPWPLTGGRLVVEERRKWMKAGAYAKAV